MKKILSLIILLNIVKCHVNGIALPFNEYAYIQARNELLSVDDFVFDQSNYKEKVVSIFFEMLKSNEFKRTGLNNFYPSRPIETELISMQSSQMYAWLKLLPKGGNIHMHENQMLNRKYFLEMIKNSDEYDMLYICDKTKPYCYTNICSCMDYYLTYFKNHTHSNKDGWVKVKDSNWTIDAIVKKTTLIGLLNEAEPKIFATDSSARWKIANDKGMFSVYSDIIKYNKTRFDYLKACLDTSLDENVQLIEFRRSNFKGLYYFDNKGNRVSLSLNYEIEMIEKFKNQYIKENPAFIDFNYILYGSRSKSKESIKSSLDIIINIHKQYSHFIRGFDIVGEEDQGHTLLFHSDSLIEGFKYSINSNKSFNYYFHTGETSWPVDMPPSQFGDETSTLTNIYDAIVFKTQRIGHGLAYFKHPQLYPYLKNRGIAIETCPASNQILGFVPDIRNHPAINYYKSGIPIVIAGDDPGSFGYNDLTVDYYMIFMSWGLNLFDLREIANNSIKFSSVTEDVRLEGYSKFSKQWYRFIDNSYNHICNNLTVDYSLINITNFFPSYGPNDVSIKMVIFGFGFENLLCQKISCYFNDIKMEANLNKLNELVCDTPLGFHANDIANISISYNNHSNRIYTDMTYKFVSSKSINIISDPLNSSETFLKFTNVLKLKIIFNLIFYCIFFS